MHMTRAHIRVNRMPRLILVAAAVFMALCAECRSAVDDECVRRSTAVTLNYCRASFYRIQRFPTLPVLFEEQEKILNNLDLNGIADQEVVKLYTGVLVEISEMRLAGRERHVVQEKYHNALGTLLTADAFDFGTQLASAHYLAAVRTGARSWWDYRNTTTVRDVDVFHVDQKRLLAFTEKSAQFLDTFWKLARDRKIPDRWLVRNQDLARLDAAMQEHDLLVRLRVLKRMEDFMTCYPPYWYYLARTHQAVGHMSAAMATYDRLLKVGQGHFRKDEMLAAGLANQAAIQNYLHRPCAVETALKALACSSDAWEANLLCAQVLGRNGRIVEAEDAVLRNLDVGLERRQSLVALVSLYTLKGNAASLQARLMNPGLVQTMPMPSLIRAAALLGPQKLPEAVTAHWASSFSARYELNYGPDDFVLVTSPSWGLQASEMSLIVGNEAYRQSTIALLPDKSEVRFARVGEVGHPLYATSNPPPAVLIVKFPDAPMVRLKISPRAEVPARPASGIGLPVMSFLTSASFAGRHQDLYLASIEIGKTEFPVSSRTMHSPPSMRGNIDQPEPGSSEMEAPVAEKSNLPSSSPSAGTSAKPISESSQPPLLAIQPLAAPAPPIPRVPMSKRPGIPPADGPKLFP